MLLVEDDPVSASALLAILHRRGHQVTHVDTVAAALAALSAGPDTVILDLMLPDGDGATVLQHLRSTGSTARVIVTTAVHDAARLSAVRELRPDQLLQKPISLVLLLQVLARPN